MVSARLKPHFLRRNHLARQLGNNNRLGLNFCFILAIDIISVSKSNKGMAS